jgi:hypothetical protein
MELDQMAKCVLHVVHMHKEGRACSAGTYRCGVLPEVRCLSSTLDIAVQPHMFVPDHLVCCIKSVSNS